jgi:DNA-binding GntR family transcriptional regulator
MARRKSALGLVRSDEGAPARRNRVNFFELAYQRIEDLLVNCELKPGRFLTVQELQDVTGFGRTPVHNAVNQFAADTLIAIQPRHGLQIAPIDLSRERLLLGLRRDIERFVVKLATERASLSHRNQALHIERVLKEKHDTITLDQFNKLDRRVDELLLEASGEPFLTHCCIRFTAASASSITAICRGKPTFQAPSTIMSRSSMRLRTGASIAR